MSAPVPRCLNHVGVSVTDIEAAADWYARVFGFTLIAPPVEVRRDGSDFGEVAADICGPRFGGMKIAHMVTGDGAGFELFEFLEPKAERRADTMEYWKNGFFHIAVTDPDIEGMVARIEAEGGRRRSKIHTLFPGEDARVCYCEDPFGNVIEIATRRYETMLANRG